MNDPCGGHSPQIANDALEDGTMPNIRTSVLCVLVILVASGAGAQVVVDFDDLPSGTVVTNQYPNATFSSEPGYVNLAFSHTSSSSAPNIICTATDGGSITCTADTYIDFTPAVNGLTLMAVEVNNAGPQCQIVVFEGGVQTAVVDVVGPMVPNGLVDLSAFSNVTRIEIVDIIDGAGIGWDDISLTPIPVELMAISVE